MAYHKLLQRQLNKYLNLQQNASEDILRFVEAVNDSYYAFDRDKELSDHAFTVSQQEFADINAQLKDEVELRKLSVEKLKSTLRHFFGDTNDFINESGYNLIEIVDRLNIEIARREEAEKQLLLAKEEAEKASMAKSEFLSVISHEIRTPLNAVIGMGHLLFKNNPRADQLENLGALRTSADNLLVLINDILDFNKIEAGQLDLEEAVCDVKKLLKSIVSANQNAANERENRMSLLIDEKVPGHFLCDSLRLGQVLNNLISNAVKFTKQGFILVKVDLLELNPQSAILNFTVQDTGVGIAPENLTNIFMPFTQASTSITRKYGGTGLGLAITRKILGLMDSDIHVESQLEKGSKFFFTLELKIVGDDEGLNEFDLTDIDLKGKKVLLVEDILFNVLYASQLLEGWNAGVEVADNGAIAVEMVKTGKFDLVLMDLRMPVMDGYTATGKIREFNTDVPIIALTASATDNVRQRVIDAGMQDYITKPLNPDECLLKIKKYIS
jgi:signal transduction histidine kinase